MFEAGWLAGSRETVSRKYLEVRSAEGAAVRRLRQESHLMYEVKVSPSVDRSGSDTLSNPIFCSTAGLTPPTPADESQRQEVTLPFIRSRMKHSLSGVWKAYVMHTMKGQSCRRRSEGRKLVAMKLAATQGKQSNSCS